MKRRDRQTQGFFSGSVNIPGTPLGAVNVEALGDEKADEDTGARASADIEDGGAIVFPRLLFLDRLLEIKCPSCSEKKIPRNGVCIYIYTIYAEIKPRVYSLQGLLMAGGSTQGSLGGSWDLVATCEWAYQPADIWVTHARPARGAISRVLSPVTSSHYVR